MRLIDADEFIVEQMKITRLSETIWQEGYWAGVDDTIGDIGKAPTIEAEPVRHGRWETAYVEDWDGTMVYEHYHRDCDYVFRNYQRHGSLYCPNCGAKMNGGK